MGIVRAFRAKATFGEPHREACVSGRFLLRLVRRVGQVFHLAIRFISGCSCQDVARATCFRRLAYLHFRAFHAVRRGGSAVCNYRDAVDVLNGILVTQDVRGVSFVVVMVGLRREDNREGAALLFGIRPIKYNNLLCLVALCNSNRLCLSTGGWRFFD